MRKNWEGEENLKKAQFKFELRKVVVNRTHAFGELVTSSASVMSYSENKESSSSIVLGIHTTNIH